MEQIKHIWEATLKSFKAHILRNLFLFLIIAAWFIFSTYWIGIINDCILSPIGKCMQPTAAIFLYWVFLILLVVYYCIVLFGKQRVVHPLRFRIAFGVAVAYFISIVFGYWSFTNWFCCFGYSDIFFLPFLLEFFFLYKVVRFSMSKEKEENEGLEFDKPVPFNEPDQVDISLHSLLIWVIRIFFRRFIQKKNELQPTNDQTQVDDKDTYGRKDYANSVAARLIKTYDDDLAFATGITGEWGSGKSSFLNLIKHEVKSKDSKIEIIDFKPWFCKSPDFIIDDFFTQFERTISVYSPSISRLLNQYALSLSDIKGTNVGAWINFTAHCFANEDTQTQYEKISKQLSEAKIKTMVFIDDTDRLDKSEIMEVLRLIRNTANFPYLQFIVAYDKEYLTSSIKDLMEGKENQYLDKIFNVEIPLPKFIENVISEKLINRLRVVVDRCFKNDRSSQKELVEVIRFINIKVKSANDIEYKLVNRLLVSSRDLIRFINSFEIAVTAMKHHFEDKALDEFNLEDLFYLELIKYKYPQAYDELRNNMINALCIDDECLYIPIKLNIETKEKLDVDYIELDENKLKEQLSRLDKPSSFKLDPLLKLQDYDLLVLLLKKLFPLDEKNNKGISSLDSYEMYFMYRSVNEYHKYSKILSLISDPNELNSIAEDNLKTCLNASLNIAFKSLIDADENNLFYEDVYKFIIELQKKKGSSQITPIIESSFEYYISLYPFKTQAQGLKLVDLIFEILNIFSEVTRKELFKLLLYKEHNIYLDEDDLNSKKQVDILKKIVTEDLILGHLKNVILNFEIIQGLSFIITDSEISDANLIVSKPDLIKHQFEILNDYFKLNVENIDMQKALTMLHYCRDEKNTYIPKAINLIREYVRSYPDKYIGVFVRINDGELGVDLFWKYIFDNESSFDEFIMDNSKDKILNIEKTRIIWKLYKNNGFQGLFLGEADPYYIDFVDKNGDKLKQDLEELVDINNILQEINVDPGTILIDVQYKLNDLKKRLSIIKLDIKLVNDITALIKKKNDTASSIFPWGYVKS